VALNALVKGIFSYIPLLIVVFNLMGEVHSCCAVLLSHIITSLDGLDIRDTSVLPSIQICRWSSLMEVITVAISILFMTNIRGILVHRVLGYLAWLGALSCIEVILLLASRVIPTL